MRLRAPLLAFALLASACGQASEPAPPTDETATPAPLPEPREAKPPPQVADFAVLESKDCGEVVRFYLGALAAREFERAALVWNDPAIDGARLAAAFKAYQTPRIAPAEPAVEGAAGSSYCSVSGTLTDAANLARPPEDGELTLRRVNDVPGATPDQLRWTLRSSTFVEPLARSDRSEP